MSERALRNLLDQPVVASDEVRLGDVSDALISLPEQRVVGLVVEWVGGREQVLGPSPNLPLSQISGFDPHQLVVHSEYAETAGLDFDPYDDAGLVLASRVLDREVVTRSGVALGQLVDVYLDELDGAILGYEVERDEAALPSRVIAPRADMEIQGDRFVVPDRLQIVSLGEAVREAEDLEAEPQEFVFEASLAERPTEDPDLVEEPGSLPED